ncbi:MAG TPA: hypothetical protein VGR00_13320, partial [Thermoanaerobaculia bacterium]|nr:hypothetical protein [Thermoanaerobaculia bacterium]
VVDLPGKEGAVERWGAPLAWFEVTNRFGKVDAAATPARFYARTEATGPYLLALPGAASPR